MSELWVQTWKESEVSVIRLHDVKFPDNIKKNHVIKNKRSSFEGGILAMKVCVINQIYFTN